MTSVESIVSAFQLPGKVSAYETWGNGLINDTFKVTLENGRLFLLQQINDGIFPDVEALMGNMERTCHQLKGEVWSYEAFELVRTHEGMLFHWREGEGESVQGTYWRMLTYLEGSVTYDVPPSLSHLEKTAEAFGHFSRVLNGGGQISGYAVEDWIEVIPDFHHLPKRLRALKNAYEVCGDEKRVQSAKGLFDQLMVERKSAELFYHKVSSCPKRLVHNDTKLNNVLFNENGEDVLAVVDLDTTMPGYLAYDFGDMIRSAVSGKYCLKDILEPLQAAYEKGFGSDIEENERVLLSDAPRWMAVELSARFLTDYLEGDLYFKISFQGENLKRAKEQFSLFEKVIKK